MSAEKRLQIAVIGAGVAGITAAHILQRKHDVTLLEKNGRIGGHTNTVVIEDGPDAGTSVDTGFIVLNDKTYPTFHRFLEQLNVPWRWSDMSFGYHCEETGLQYAGTNLNGLFAQRLNLLRPAFLGMVADIMRFGKTALRDLDDGRMDGHTLGQYMDKEKFGKPFVHDYILPMGAAIWSTPPQEMLDFPAETFSRFFKNHGLLSLNDRPRWQTVVGGSHSYLKAFTSQFKGKIRIGTEIRHVKRGQADVSISFKDGKTARFDKVVIAAHADEAIGLLADPSLEETRLLGAWSYQRNHTVLHTDDAVLPPNPRAWASWNYVREAGRNGSGPVSVTYHMNRLQGLKSNRQYCVTLNRSKPIAGPRIIREFEYTHPAYTFGALAAQKELPSLSGKRNSYFCGSYFGYGFHEDAVRSGVAVARQFGLEL